MADNVKTDREMEINAELQRLHDEADAVRIKRTHQEVLPLVGTFWKCRHDGDNEAHYDESKTWYSYRRYDLINDTVRELEFTVCPDQRVEVKTEEAEYMIHVGNPHWQQIHRNEYEAAFSELLDHIRAINLSEKQADAD